MKNEEQKVESVSAGLNRKSLKEWFALLREGVNMENIQRLLPMLLLGFGFCIAFIYKNHHVAKTVKEISELKKEMKELRAEEAAVKFNLMNQSRQSKVAEKLKETGVKELTEPPYKLKQQSKE